MKKNTWLAIVLISICLFPAKISAQSPSNPGGDPLDTILMKKSTSDSLQIYSSLICCEEVYNKASGIYTNHPKSKSVFPRFLATTTEYDMVVISFYGKLNFSDVKKWKNEEQLLLCQNYTLSMGNHIWPRQPLGD